MASLTTVLTVWVVLKCIKLLNIYINLKLEQIQNYTQTKKKKPQSIIKLATNKKKMMRQLLICYLWKTKMQIKIPLKEKKRKVNWDETNGKLW